MTDVTAIIIGVTFGAVLSLGFIAWWVNRDFSA